MRTAAGLLCPPGKRSRVRTPRSTHLSPDHSRSQNGHPDRQMALRRLRDSSCHVGRRWAKCPGLGHYRGRSDLQYTACTARNCSAQWRSRRCRRGICRGKGVKFVRNKSCVRLLVACGLSARREGQRRVSRARAGAVPGCRARCAVGGLKACAVSPGRAHVADSASSVGRKLPRDTRKADSSRLAVG